MIVPRPVMIDKYWPGLGRQIQIRVKAHVLFFNTITTKNEKALEPSGADKAASFGISENLFSFLVSILKNREVLETDDNAIQEIMRSLAIGTRIAFTQLLIINHDQHTF
jgi:hypothetical protein